MTRSRKVAAVLALLAWSLLVGIVAMSYLKRQQYETHTTVFIRNSTNIPFTKVTLGTGKDVITFNEVGAFSMSETVNLGPFKEPYRRLVVERRSRPTLEFGSQEVPSLEVGDYKIALVERQGTIKLETKRVWGWK